MILSGSRNEIEQQAATMISRAIEHAINKNDQAIMAVVGGRSIGGLLGALGRERLDWQKVHLFLADERLVPTDHPDSNFRLIRPHVETFIPRENLHPFRHAQADEIKSLQNYQQELSDCGGGFDISLLSSGEDGHVASLFPDHHTIRAADDSFLLTHSAPKPPPGRMSASRTLLAGSSLAVVLFYGQNKRRAFSAFLDPSISVEQCPAKLVLAIPEHYSLKDWSE